MSAPPAAIRPPARGLSRLPRLRLERRAVSSRFWALASPLLAVLLTMLTGGILFALLGKDPVRVLATIFWEPLVGEFAWYLRGQVLVKASPLIMIAVGLAIGFRAGIWNIGAEGQYIIGAIIGAGVALAFYPGDPVAVSLLGGRIEFMWGATLPRALLFPLATLAGALGGWLWAIIPAILRTRFNTNEILTSLMLVYVAETIVAKAATGFLRNPESTGFPGSRNFSTFAAANNAEFLPGWGTHWGAVVAIVAALLAHVLLTRHIIGFRIRLAGEAPRAARFHGVNVNRLVIFCMGVSGALAGLAGFFEVAGPAGQISIDFASGYGFTAIVVAFLGRLNPLGIILAGLLLALTYVGGEMAATNLGIPAAAAEVLRGMLLFFLLGVDVLTSYRLRIGRGRRA